MSNLDQFSYSNTTLIYSQELSISLDLLQKLWVSLLLVFIVLPPSEKVFNLSACHCDKEKHANDLQ